MQINTIIVDDEKPAREELAYLLKGFPEINVIGQGRNGDRKSTRLNSSHSQISYAVFCLKKINNLIDDLLPPHCIFATRDQAHIVRQPSIEAITTSSSMTIKLISSASRYAPANESVEPTR